MSKIESSEDQLKLLEDALSDKSITVYDPVIRDDGSYLHCIHFNNRLTLKEVGEIREKLEEIFTVDTNITHETMILKIRNKRRG